MCGFVLGWFVHAVLFKMNQFSKSRNYFGKQSFALNFVCRVGFIYEANGQKLGYNHATAREKYCLQLSMQSTDSNPLGGQTRGRLEYLLFYFLYFNPSGLDSDYKSGEAGVGVVQHRLIAGSCRPLRVLFISSSFLFNQFKRFNSNTFSTIFI